MTVTDTAPDLSISRAAEADPRFLRRVFGAFPTGVTALAGLVDGAPVGIAASSFTSVSLEPALVSVCVAHTSSTWPALRTASRIGVSVLASHQDVVARRLSGPAHERFDGVDWRTGADGAIFIDDAAAWLECSVHQTIRAGDHDIIVLGVHDLDATEAAEPLVFHASGFGRLARSA